MSLKLKIHQRSTEKFGDVLAILIHGLSAPFTFTDKESNWRDYILKDPKLDKVDVGIITYDTAKLARGLFQLGDGYTSIDELAHELKSELELEDYEMYSKIVLVGHSMGGLLGIRYLIEEITRGKSTRVVSYISLATPFNGSHLADFHRLIKWATPHKQIPQMEPNSKFIGGTIRKWIDLMIKSKLTGVEFTFCYGVKDKDVDRYSAIPHVVADDWEVPALDGDHTSILRLSDGNEPRAYKVVRDLIRKALRTPPSPPTDKIDQQPLTIEDQSMASGHLSNGSAEGGFISSTTGTPPLGLATLTPVGRLLEKHRPYMNRFVSHCPKIQKELTNSMQAVYNKLSAMTEDKFQRFLDSYRLTFLGTPCTYEGIPQLWKLLTITHNAFPNWSFDLANETSNMKFDSANWKKVIHSVDRDPMSEILLSLATKSMTGSLGPFIIKGQLPIFPHGLIIDHFENDLEGNLCKHCRIKSNQTPSFGNIIQFFTNAEDKGVISKLEENNYKFIEESDVCCTSCIQKQANNAQDFNDLVVRIKEVV